VVEKPVVEKPVTAPVASGPALAKPPVRKLARDLGVDLRRLAGSGPNGTITRDDVEAAVGSPDRSAAAAPAARTIDFDPATREQRIPIKGVRKQMAAAMVSSAFTAPHVTEFVTVDVTPMVEMVERLKGMREFAEVRVTPLLLVAKALLVAVRRNPLVNATWDEAAQEIVVKDYVNLGIAAATPRGLIVPNIKDAGSLPLPDLARELQQLVATARDGKTAPADMQQGTITITNVGVFGVDTGTPIINPGEAAILCFGAVRDMPWVHEGELAVRKVTQLAVSFDHRLIDGQLGSQFLADIAAMLADPGLFLAWS
jgi:pyruvate dehydrogenase E2 component (dihydrolipoamide acetyltransferase)